MPATRNDSESVPIRSELARIVAVCSSPSITSGWFPLPELERSVG